MGTRFQRTMEITDGFLKPFLETVTGRKSDIDRFREPGTRALRKQSGFSKSSH